MRTAALKIEKAFISESSQSAYGTGAPVGHEVEDLERQSSASRLVQDRLRKSTGEFVSSRRFANGE